MRPISPSCRSYRARLDTRNVLKGLVVVLDDGEHHNAAVTTLDFWAIVGAFIVFGCILARKPTKKPPTETLRPVVPSEHQPGCFALEEETGANWKGSGGAVPSIKETRPTL